jgi:catechol 2,3-dioxygenase-like lactoylglutathione lyase family enzyme
MPAPSASDVKVFVPARNFDRSLRFYEALGWTQNARHDGLAEIELAGVRLYVQDFYVPAWAENFMIYMVVENAQLWHEHVRDVIQQGDFPGARVEPPTHEDYGALVTYVWDPSGVLIHCAESIP